MAFCWQEGSSAVNSISLLPAWQLKVKRGQKPVATLWVMAEISALEIICSVQLLLRCRVSLLLAADLFGPSQLQTEKDLCVCVCVQSAQRESNNFTVSRNTVLLQWLQMKLFRTWPVGTSHIKSRKKRMNFQPLRAQCLLFITQDWINRQLGGKSSLVPHYGCKFCSLRSPLVSCLAPPVTPARVKIAVNRT